MRRTGPIELVLLFAVPGLLLAAATRAAIPWLHRRTLWPLEVCWFLSAGLLVLLPLLVAAIWFSGKEIGSFHVLRLAKRMRIGPMRSADWAWLLGAMGLVGALTMLMLRLGRLVPGFDPSPEFFPNLPLQRNNAWLLGAWLPFFFVNIFGEELWWRGYVLPRQELLQGRPTWLAHGLLWAAFHAGLGWCPVWLALPHFLILPLVVQIRKNTTIAILLHGLFGALGFLSLALGLVAK